MQIIRASDSGWRAGVVSEPMALLAGLEIGRESPGWHWTGLILWISVPTAGMDTRPELLTGVHLGWIAGVSQNTQADARLTYNHSLTANRALRFVVEAVKPTGHAALSTRLDYCWYF